MTKTVVPAGSTSVVTAEETRRSGVSAATGSSSLQAAEVRVVRQAVVTQRTVSKLRAVPSLVVETRRAAAAAPVVYE